jgi:predicted Rossmann fold nucleotide-binding protein DprA/Smf involved in DNA uptake
MRETAQIADTIGNKELLKLKKSAFLCSRKISASAVLKCYDWAIEQRENGHCVISGFHSKIEKDVFHYLSKGSQPIILALPRGLKKRWEPEIKSLLETDKFLIITPFEKSVTRITEETSKVRNELMVGLADEVVAGYKSKRSKLSQILSKMDSGKEINYITE